MKEIFPRALNQSIRVSWMIIKIYIPLSLFTILLKRLGVIDFIAPFFAPMMKLMGLPGETAITVIAGSINNVYAALGTMAAFDLTFREITILGIVIGISHNLIVETGILINLKMANFKIAFFRVCAGIITGIVINTLMPQNMGGVILNPYHKVAEFSWTKSFQSVAVTSIQIIIIISVIMLVYEVISLWKYSSILKQKARFIPRVFGFSDNAFGPWIVGFLVGIAYGAGILFRFAKDHKLTHKDMCLITLFLCLAHAVIEDTMLFVVIGGNFGWIVLTRLVIAFITIRTLSINNLYQKFLWVGLPKKH